MLCLFYSLRLSRNIKPKNGKIKKKGLGNKIADRKMRRWHIGKNKKQTSGAFVNKDGLFISANHPDNAQVNENEICFHLFQLWQ
ncbi:MAG TPA: hypothetical protein PKE17_04100 [Saprospiraceae bacterium]|nr:hypothetical protein [Saprospiraceae bacterium]